MVILYWAEDRFSYRAKELLAHICFIALDLIYRYPFIIHHSSFIKKLRRIWEEKLHSQLNNVFFFIVCTIEFLVGIYQLVCLSRHHHPLAQSFCARKPEVLRLA